MIHVVSKLELCLHSDGRYQINSPLYNLQAQGAATRILNSLWCCVSWDDK